MRAASRRNRVIAMMAMTTSTPTRMAYSVVPWPRVSAKHERTASPGGGGEGAGEDDGSHRRAHPARHAHARAGAGAPGIGQVAFHGLGSPATSPLHRPGQRPPPGGGADDSEQSRQLGRRRQPHCTAENRAAEHQAHSRLPIARRRQRAAKTGCGRPSCQRASSRRCRSCLSPCSRL